MRGGIEIAVRPGAEDGGDRIAARGVLHGEAELERMLRIARGQLRDGGGDGVLAHAALGQRLGLVERLLRVLLRQRRDDGEDGGIALLPLRQLLRQRHGVGGIRLRDLGDDALHGRVPLRALRQRLREAHGLRLIVRGERGVDVRDELVADESVLRVLRGGERSLGIKLNPAPDEHGERLGLVRAGGHRLRLLDRVGQIGGGDVVRVGGEVLVHAIGVRLAEDGRQIVRTGERRGKEMDARVRVWRDRIFRQPSDVYRRGERACSVKEVRGEIAARHKASTRQTAMSASFIGPWRVRLLH